MLEEEADTADETIQQQRPCNRPFERKFTEDSQKENRLPTLPILSELRSKMCRQNLQIVNCLDNPTLLEPGLKSPAVVNISHRRWKHLESLQEVRKIHERLAVIRENRQIDDYEMEPDYI